MKLNLTVQPRFRLDFSPLVWILLTLMGIAFVVAMMRYAFGIGVISDLSYSYPWGFWISFDLFTGVAISSGGFLMAGTVYILRIKEFEPLLRPSVLTAFIGYVMVAIALLVDLGQPLRIWYMMIHWNGTSVLLEIGICVMLYLTVLAIEFAPVALEGFKLQKWAHLIHKFIMPFVILGVVLSTLHQSSLGSLLLIQPSKLHPLWWTPILPIMFFTSASQKGFFHSLPAAVVVLGFAALLPRFISPRAQPPPPAESGTNFRRRQTNTPGHTYEAPPPCWFPKNVRIASRTWWGCNWAGLFHRMEIRHCFSIPARATFPPLGRGVA